MVATVETRSEPEGGDRAVLEWRRQWRRGSGWWLRYFNLEEEVAVAALLMEEEAVIVV